MTFFDRNHDGKKHYVNNAMEMMGLMSNAIIKDCFDKINELRKEIGE